MSQLNTLRNTRSAGTIGQHQHRVGRGGLAAKILFNNGEMGLDFMICNLIWEKTCL